MIGIGVTTTSERNLHLQFFLNQIKKYTGGVEGVDYIIDVAKNYNNISEAKNQNLKNLKDCDYIYIFDNDTFPVKHGWVDYFVQASKETGQNHFIYAKPSPTIRPKQVKYFDTIALQEWTECSGCFMFLTKEVIEKVGYYNPKYKGYGYEHAGYTNRVFNSGLNTIKYCQPIDASEYLYCMDFDFYLPYNKFLKHKPTLSYSEISKNLGHNRDVFVQDCQTIYQNYV